MGPWGEILQMKFFSVLAIQTLFTAELQDLEQLNFTFRYREILFFFLSSDGIRK